MTQRTHVVLCAWCVRWNKNRRASHVSGLAHTPNANRWEGQRMRSLGVSVFFRAWPCVAVCVSLSLSLSLSCLCATYLSRLLLPRILLETDLYRRTRSNLNGATHRTKNRSPTFTFWEPLPILIQKERPLTFSRPCLSPFLYRVERRDFGLQRDAGILHNLFALGNASFLF